MRFEGEEEVGNLLAWRSLICYHMGESAPRSGEERHDHAHCQCIGVGEDGPRPSFVCIYSDININASTLEPANRGWRALVTAKPI